MRRIRMRRNRSKFEKALLAIMSEVAMITRRVILLTFGAVVMFALYFLGCFCYGKFLNLKKTASIDEVTEVEASIETASVEQTEHSSKTVSAVKKQSTPKATEEPTPTPTVCAEEAVAEPTPTPVIVTPTPVPTATPIAVTPTPVPTSVPVVEEEAVAENTFDFPEEWFDEEEWLDEPVVTITEEPKECEHEYEMVKKVVMLAGDICSYVDHIFRCKYCGKEYGEYYMEANEDIDYAAVKNRIVARVNEMRTAAGLNALWYGDSMFEEFSEERAREISDFFGHVRPDGSDPTVANEDYYVIFENISYGYISSDSCFEGFYDSPGHRNAMMYDEAVGITIGIYVEDDFAYIQMSIIAAYNGQYTFDPSECATANS